MSEDTGLGTYRLCGIEVGKPPFLKGFSARMGQDTEINSKRKLQGRGPMAGRGNSLMYVFHNKA